MDCIKIKVRVKLHGVEARGKVSKPYSAISPPLRKLFYRSFSASFAAATKVNDARFDTKVPIKGKMAPNDGAIKRRETKVLQFRG